MNISEGRDEGKLRAIATVLQKSSSSYLLGYDSDPDHHRTVFSFIGTPRSIDRSAFLAIKTAVQLIDLRVHEGAHPRIGAADVVPFVPITGVSMPTCVQIARQLAGKVAQELDIPVYLYGAAAMRPERQNLAAIRRGGLKKLLHEIETNPSRQPDLGPHRLHPSTGATTIGVRGPLIAFNVYLDSPDAVAAQKIARRVRESNGGLPAVQALGFLITSRNQAQVSMNLTDYRRSSLWKAFRTVCTLAREFEIRVASSEIVGLVPRNALKGFSVNDLRLENFHPGLILENRIAEVIKPFHREKSE